jgi:hypothetical protein
MPAERIYYHNLKAGKTAHIRNARGERWPIALSGVPSMGFSGIRTAEAGQATFLSLLMAPEPLLWPPGRHLHKYMGCRKPGAPGWWWLFLYSRSCSPDSP